MKKSFIWSGKDIHSLFYSVLLSSFFLIDLSLEEERRRRRRRREV
jgi:hypothetical protein